MRTHTIILILLGLLLFGCRNEIIAKPIDMLNTSIPSNQTETELQPEEPIIPETIENYRLTDIINQSDCDSLEDAGYPGIEVCQENQRLKYQDNKNKTIFVILINITKGLQQGKEYILTNFSNRTEIIDNQTIYRIEDHELLWFPKQGFDIVSTQESEAKYDQERIVYHYENASKDNPVFNQFLSMYPTG